MESDAGLKMTIMESNTMRENQLNIDDSMFSANKPILMQ
jgi:hypothetical protein